MYKKVFNHTNIEPGHGASLWRVAFWTLETFVHYWPLFPEFLLGKADEI
jgi:hypothetical protein